jgi:hypothetical protein
VLAAVLLTNQIDINLSLITPNLYFSSHHYFTSVISTLVVKDIDKIVAS